ncbi:hypothetical protein BSKO_08203 [Bryopsis sp. KO-2023]|nr:hypothetical protein BSKO_08203 [Bryopsis sp. KO-2023]
MASDGKSRLEQIGSSLRNVHSRPGTVRVSRKEPDEPSAVAVQDSNGPVPPPEDASVATSKNGHQAAQKFNAKDAQGGSPQEQVSNSGSNDVAPEDTDSSRRVDGGLDATTSSSFTSASRSKSTIAYKKFNRILDTDMIKMDELREISWSGIPPQLRPECWRLLLGYLPPNRERQASVLARKRKEYLNMVPEYYDIANNQRSEEELGALRQVAVDVPRTAPGVPFFQHAVIQKSLERILYIWGIRHPASGYVQGINDLVTPFLVVFTSEHFEGGMESWETWDLDHLSEEVVLGIEADCYWCLCKLLDGIQDHYTSAQPGIQRTVFKVKELVSRINQKLAFHFENQEVDFLQFAFRWVNCLLLREFPFEMAPRLWDTYIAEAAGTKFSEFLAYTCATFLLHWVDIIHDMEFQDLIMFLQKLPTSNWTEKEVEMILSTAFMYQSSFGKSSSHLGGW